MVNQESANDLSQRVALTVRDTTDFSQGAAAAAYRLQYDIAQNYQQLGYTQDYRQYLDSVTAGLRSSGLFDEVAAGWAQNNRVRFDSNNDGRLDQGEINSALQRSQNPLETALLVSVRDNYQSVKHEGGDGFLGIRPNSLGSDDINSYLDHNQERRNALVSAQAERQQSKYLMQPLLTTADGNWQNSLFSVLDNVTGGEKDGNISRHDLKSFVEQYDRAAMNGGDVNQGAFTRANRDYADRLARNWNTAEVERLRGSHIDEQADREQDWTNDYITLDGLRAAAGAAPGTNLFLAFRSPAPVERRVVQAPCPQGPSPEEIARAQARSQFESQVRQHIDSEAHYRVKPGQGFDRIAKDVICQHADQATCGDARAIVNYSNYIAKMNGRHGRLDKTPVLHPGDNLKVFDDDWMAARIQERMMQFDSAMNKR